MGPSVTRQDEPSIERLRKLIATLRGRDGCPWDRKQTPSSLTVYLIEEMYELVEAVEADDTDAIREELGDVLFQVIFLASLYDEMRRFSLEAVVEENLSKMIRRHPHVFGDSRVDSVSEVRSRWREIKRQEKASDDGSVLDSIPSGMPALMRAFRVSERAAGTGFDWPDLAGVMGQVESEWNEFKAEFEMPDTDSGNRENMAMEFGDLLFSMINVARLARIHPETALSRSTQKFTRRFKQMETMARRQRGRALDDLPREEMERLWSAAKESD
jgi:tetrapyrrole methylase family protein/MazG family protein